MRFLIAEPGPAFSVQDIYEGWREALTATGQTVVTFNLADRLAFYGNVLLEAPEVGEGAFKRALSTEDAVKLSVDGLYSAILKTRPHVLLIVSGFFVPPELMAAARAAGVKVALLHTESPYEDQRQAKLAEHADVNIIDDPTNLEAFPPGTVYLPKAYRPSVHHPGPPTPALACDLAFCGTGFPSRIAFFEAMDLDGLDVVLAGNWQPLTEASPLRRFLAGDVEECLDNRAAADLYRSARAGINLYRREAQADHLAVGYAMGPREVEMAACGLFFLRDPRPEGDEVLDMLPTFTGPQDASEQLRWWLAHDDQREAAARKAQAAIADRTFDANAANLLRLIGEG